MGYQGQSIKPFGHGGGIIFKTCGDSPNSWDGCRHMWGYRVRINGKQVENHNQFETKTEVTNHLAKVRADKGRGQRPTLSGETFEAYAETFYQGQKGKLAQSSLKNYQGLLKHWINPVIGSMPIGQIQRHQVKEVILTAQGKGMPARRQDTLLAVLTSVFAEAKRDKANEHEPTSGLSRFLDEIEEADRYIPDMDEIRAVAAEFPEYTRAIVFLMAGTGLRLGEALAVNEKCLIGGGVLRVYEQYFGNGRFGPAKTAKKGKRFRDTPIPSWAENEIKKLIKAKGTTPGGYVFRANGNGDLPPAPKTVTGHFTTARKVAKLPASFSSHCLRHYFATIMITNGAQISDVAEWLGHATIQITYNTYKHLLKPSFEKACKIMETEFETSDDDSGGDVVPLAA